MPQKTEMIAGDSSLEQLLTQKLEKFKTEDRPEAVEELNQFWQASRKEHESNQKGFDATGLLGSLSIQTTISPGIHLIDTLNTLPSNWWESFIVITDQKSFDFFSEQYCFTKPKEIFFLDSLKTGSDLKELIGLIQDAQPTVLVGVGSGYVLDLLKFISMQTNIPMIAIPTSLSTHVYGSQKVHCYDLMKDLGHTLTLNGIRPQLVLIDFSLVSYLFEYNKRLIFAGFGDIMAFFNGREDWKLAVERGKATYSEAVDELIQTILDTLVNINPKMPLESWLTEYLTIQVLLCYITDWVGSHPASGAEHLFAKVLEESIPRKVLHGELVAFGTLIFISMRGGDTRIVCDLIRKFSLPTSLSMMGAKLDEVVNALEKASEEGLRKDRHTILDELDYSREDYEELLQIFLDSRAVTF